MPERIRVRGWETPLGRLLLGAVGKELCLAEWADSPKRDATLGRLEQRLGASIEEGDSALLDEAGRQLDEYFRGERRAFSLPLRLAGTPFQEAAWGALLTIHYGRVITYGEQARLMGRPKATRAVGLANGANPLCIFVPCHRVVGADGSLTGYSAGLRYKRGLLALESPGLL